MNENLFSFSSYIISKPYKKVKAIMALFSLFLVGRDGVEPPQSLDGRFTVC